MEFPNFGDLELWTKTLFGCFIRMRVRSQRLNINYSLSKILKKTLKSIRNVIKTRNYKKKMLLIIDIVIVNIKIVCNF